MYIIHPEVTPEKFSALNEKLKGILAQNDADIINFEDWGNKKLAYRVKKHEKGHYCLINYAGPPKAIQEFERVMKLSDDVIKYLSVKITKDQLDRLKKKLAAKEKAERESAAAEELKAQAPQEEEVKAEKHEAEAEAPAAETPAAETPAVEAVAAETPAVEAVAAEAPADEAPAVEGDSAAKEPEA
jgi:small subunit ribosomal protein S6